jgi:hypothetical protein
MMRAALLLIAALATSVPAAPVRFAMDAALMVGFDIGGTYVFGRREARR